MARTWFSASNTSASSEDIKILNRAARCYANERGATELSHQQLCKIRDAYKGGMSARAVVDKVYEEDGE